MECSVDQTKQLATARWLFAVNHSRCRCKMFREWMRKSIHLDQARVVRLHKQEPGQ